LKENGHFSEVLSHSEDNGDENSHNDSLKHGIKHYKDFKSLVSSKTDEIEVYIGFLMILVELKISTEI